MKKIKNKIALLFTVLFFGVLALLAYQIFFAMEDVKITVKNIYNEKIPEQLNQYRIGIISDIKYQKFMNKERFEKIVQQLNTQNVDTVIFLGDLYDDSVTEITTENELTLLLQKIKAPYGKFYVSGDIDIKQSETVNKILKAARFEDINDKLIQLHKNEDAFIEVLGLSISSNLEILNQTREDKFTLAFTHYPEKINDLPESIQYTVAGHTLGGQINIPIFDTLKKIPHSGSYLSGEYLISKQKTLYVNSGLGTTKNDIRFLANPEITILQLHNKKN